jgi:hypothetical protein
LRKNAVLLIWAAGLALAAVLYEVRPDHAARAVAVVVEGLPRRAAEALDLRSGPLLRAAALALFAVFLALGALAWRRGRRSAWLLILVVAGVLALLHRPAGDGSELRWTAATLLAGGGAALLTRRLGGR